MTDSSNRNIVLITADSLRADQCGFVDSDSELTPTIDGLADEGVAYTQAVAPGPRTPSSVPVIFTGEFMADDDDWTTEAWQRRQRRIGQHMSRFTHLSERLQRRGYETAAFTANPWTTRESNFAAGFDDFTEISADSDDISSRHLSDSLLFKLADLGFETLPIDPFNWSWKKEWFSQWTGYFELIREKISQLSEPFFLWVFLMDAHQPYITPRQFREEGSAWKMYYSTVRYWQGEVADEALPSHAREMIGETYRDTVRSVDAFVDALTDEVDRYDPITVFTADHGEALGEHGNFGHRQTLYEENVRVPLFVHNAGRSETVDEQVPLRSLSEILDDLADPDQFDPRERTQPFVISQIENNRVASIRSSRWKFVSDGDEGRLFDLANDPEETNDVRATYPKVSSSLGELLDRHRATEVEKMRSGDAVEMLLAEEPSL